MRQCADAQHRRRAKQQVSERRNNTIYRQQRHANLTTEQQESERRNITAYGQRRRANITPDSSVSWKSTQQMFVVRSIHLL